MLLQVVGLSIEEAIIFWRKAFGGTLTDDKFNKEYRYNIRHSYGLEGKRANYAAKRCVMSTSRHVHADTTDVRMCASCTLCPTAANKS